MAAALRERLRASMAAPTDEDASDSPAGTFTSAEWHSVWTADAVDDVIGEMRRLAVDAAAAPDSGIMPVLSQLVRACILLDAGTTCCACRDAEVLDGLLAALHVVYTPGTLTGELDGRMLAAGRLAEALRVHLVRTSRRFSYRPPRAVVTRQPSESCTRTPMDALSATLADPLLVEAMADQWEVGLRRLVSGSSIDGMVPDHELGIHALVVAVVRPVLDTLPDVTTSVVRWLTTLTTRVGRMTAIPYVSTLLQTLCMLSATAPAQLRAARSAPAAVAAAYRLFTSYDAVPTDAFALGDGDAVALALLLHAVMAPTGCPSAPALRGHRAAMAMIVAAAGAEAGGTAFTVSPTALAAHLGAGVSPPAADLPWAPAAFPPAALPPAATVPSTRCWACGSAGHERGAARGTLTRLQRCSECAVGRACSPDCHAALWRASHKRACGGWRRWAAAAAAGSATATGGGGNGGGDGQPGHVAMFRPRAVDMRGEWKGWVWPAALAAEVEAVGLELRDVVVYADPGWGIMSVLPEGDYRWKPDAVAARFLAAPLEKHGGRVLRVVNRAHPPTVRSFGPRSLRLVV
ncbi:hypothetical protein BU14_0459s0014 [Porphyra umbilicalis]|uniref:MYND-type domain-containing protein n=1 Tax=Porphyra umbilicalis TaxID=2786 RepID=A0A1X6NUZ3_PORUM|nr:hypothetical protein BU14_0459s0014 [Porphyra umbilicalis]|eukprot:OSX72193.1 hypothetical protein BU14_0459s0014 [Porphyra umbilicalis]